MGKMRGLLGGCGASLGTFLGGVPGCRHILRVLREGMPLRYTGNRVRRGLAERKTRPKKPEEIAFVDKEFERNFDLRRFGGPFEEPPTGEPFDNCWMPSPVFTIPKKMANWWRGHEFAEGKGIRFIDHMSFPRWNRRRVERHLRRRRAWHKNFQHKSMKELTAYMKSRNLLPTWLSINAGVRQDENPVCFPDLDKVLDKILDLGRGTLMADRDFADRAQLGMPTLMA